MRWNQHSLISTNSDPIHLCFPLVLQQSVHQTLRHSAVIFRLLTSKPSLALLGHILVWNLSQFSPRLRVVLGLSNEGQ